MSTSYDTRSSTFNVIDCYYTFMLNMVSTL